MLPCNIPQKFPFRRPLPFLIAFVLLVAGIAGCARQEHLPEGAMAPGPGQTRTAGPEAAPEGPPAAGPATGTAEGLPPAALSPKPSVASADHCFRSTRSSDKSSRKGKRKTGRCEPQSLPFARCRSGINTCKLGDTGPLTWFACERKRGNTGDLPRQGSILILDANSRRGMPTGHVVYVEEVIAETPDTWKFILSHTNYDRRCSMETNIEARYHGKAKSIDFLTGAWKAWGQGLKVAGFILD